MAENVDLTGGRPSSFKFDRGGMPSENGPYVGIIVNNVDNTFSGRLQVVLEEFGSRGANGELVLDNISEWRMVRYCSPFYGVTQKSGTNTGTGGYPGNQQSYGMWFTPPDIGVKVLCFFPAGSPDKGFYVGCVPEIGINHMIPALGAADNYTTDNVTQSSYFAKSPQLPVTEINVGNKGIEDNPKFFDAAKPVHAYQASIFFQQGLDTDTERGPITSNSQRETPSTVYGISTPGLPIYQGGLQPNDIRKKVQAKELKPEDVTVIGRLGGHTLVMDDGDLEGNNALYRMRSSKGHQIIMNDSQDFMYFIHANGQAWMEFGSEGTVDVYSTNSVNFRTEGDINFHADRDINMYANANVNIKSNKSTNIGAVEEFNLASEKPITMYSTTSIGIKTDGSLTLKSKTSGWDGGGSLALKAGRIDLNGAAPGDVQTPKLFPKIQLDDVEFDNSKGWQTVPKKLETIVTRAPTHEPYSYHNEGVDVKVSLEEGTPTPPPAAEPVPNGFTIKVK
jgi:hypothetical protein